MKAEASARSGFIEISSIDIEDFTRSSSVKITKMVSSISLYMGIFDKAIYGTIQVQDAVGIHNKFPIVGEEYCTLTFRITTKEDPIVVTMRIVSISDMEYSDQYNTVVYTLNLVSELGYNNMTGSSAKQAVDAYPDEVIQFLISNTLLDPSKELPLYAPDNYKDKIRTVFPKHGGFRAIDSVCRKSFSSDNLSSLFTFFEDYEKFNFVSIEKLIEENKQDPILINFNPIKTSKNTYNNKSQIDHEFFDVTVISHLEYNDSQKTIFEGLIDSEIVRYDMITGKVQNQKFDFVNDVAPRIQLLQDQVIPFNSDQFREFMKGDTELIGDNNMYDYAAQETDIAWSDHKLTFGARAAIAAMLNQNRIIVVLPGNTYYQPGQVFEIKNFPAGTMYKDQPNDNPNYNGLYLCTDLKQNILGDSYSTVIGLAKLNYGRPFELGEIGNQ